MIGSSSLPVTGLLSATFWVPLGARKGGRGLPVGFLIRVPGGACAGVPLKAGLGSFSLSGTSLPFASVCFDSLACAALALSSCDWAQLTGATPIDRTAAMTAAR